MDQDRYRIGRLAGDVEQIDCELARLALLCRVQLLHRGVIERVLQRDRSVCGTDNPIAFEKLRGMLMLYFAMREQAARDLGQSQTVAVESYVVARLSKSFPELAAAWPPA